MKKEEFETKLKEVSVILHSLAFDDGVYTNTSLYGFLMSADMAVSLAADRVSEFVDEVNVTFCYDEERKAGLTQSL